MGFVTSTIAIASVVEKVVATISMGLRSGLRFQRVVQTYGGVSTCWVPMAIVFGISKGDFHSETHPGTSDARNMPP